MASKSLEIEAAREARAVAPKRRTPAAADNDNHRPADLQAYTRDWQALGGADYVPARAKAWWVP